MTDIIISRDKIDYNKETKTFYGSERNVKFDTSYKLINGLTGKRMVFNFKHSTGPEFDPKTQWVYKSEEGYTLSIGNDAEITKILAQNYLKGKLCKN